MRIFLKLTINCFMLLCLASCTWLGSKTDYMTQAHKQPADTAVNMPADPGPERQVIDLPDLPQGPLKLTLSNAVLLCLENNRALVVEKLNPVLTQTNEDQQRAAFDPILSAQMSVGRVKDKDQSESAVDLEDQRTDLAAGTISLAQYFPTGTTISLVADTQMEDDAKYSQNLYQTRIGMTITQALLKGYGADANLVRLKQARLDTRMSEFELRGFTSSLVAQVEKTYWDFSLARRQIQIVEESLKVIRQQLDETKKLIAVGRLAKAELAAVQAEVAAQQQALIEARANKESIRLQLLRLLNPPGPDMWQRKIDLIHQPTLPKINLEDVDQHVTVALRMRAVLNQARLEITRGDLEVIKTKNGLLPVMDLFITLGKSGYAESFGRSVSHLDQDTYDAMAGISFEYPFFNRNANAMHQKALLSRQQSQDALQNLTQLVEMDVRTAYIEVDRTRQQIDASSIKRKYDEEKLRTETEKLRVGKSTSFLVAQAQRDVLASRIAEVKALVNYLESLIDLYRLDGSLLDRRGIDAPGGQSLTQP